ncbi:nucleotidyltransferase domain-containing protein [Candidatus Pacearchaeota archaeon]|nr:nucleotidyltransferase domain-containing protein [Candidatus Pacearchaeota archaeon]
MKEKKEAKEALEKPKKKAKKKQINRTEYPTLQLINEKEIAMDFATKVYEKFNEIIKSIILFGSTAKETAKKESDIDIVVIIDDASIQWDEELKAWYREELGKIVQGNPYKKGLHINTVRLTTWWLDLLRGDPVVINVIRYGEPLIDFAGFFHPMKALLLSGKIKPTPEAIYTLLQRAPLHLGRSRLSLLGSIEGIYWSMVDSAHAAIIAAKKVPPSPEHIPMILKETFVDKNMLKLKYVVWYRDLHILHKSIVHGETKEVRAKDIEEWHLRADEFLRRMAEIVNQMINVK